jgi:murein DD-endopeptidase MepM/ murein hydrolase activator NlpD
MALACLGAPAESSAGGASAGAYHVIKKGETLYSVAKVYGLSPDAIAKANDIDDPARLRIGTRLLIPSVHRVAKGETLFGIARTYGVGLEALRKANGLTEASVIKPGDSVLIPSAAAPAPPAAAPAPIPDTVRLSPRTAEAKVIWPCLGEVSYLDGKAYGVVIKTKPGEPQKAVASGTVTFADVFRGYGRVVMVVSSNGFTYVYGGNDVISVQAGEKVRSGQEIGKIGVDARQGGPAAYFLVTKDGEAVDPALAPRD